MTIKNNLLIEGETWLIMADRESLWIKFKAQNFASQVLTKHAFKI